MMLLRQPVSASTGGACVDYDLHGFVGIRLLGASDSDVAAVAGQLGPIRGGLQRAPDIIIRFVDRVPAPGARLLGATEAAFTDSSFFVLRGRHKTAVRVQVPMAEVGGPCEIVCGTGVPAVPLLIPIINLTALAKGVLPLHASAFVHRGKGVLVTGWAKGGKTEALLAFVAHGAGYIGDEWVYVSPDGRRLHGIPEPITLWDWHLDDLPQFRARLTAAQRARLRAGRVVTERLGRAAQRRAGILARALPLLERQGAVNATPAQLLGTRDQPLEGDFDRLFFVVSHDLRDVVVSDVSAEYVARRMVFSLLYERRDLLTEYLRFRFAFPERPNALIEDLERIQREALQGALAGKPAHLVAHPWPASIPALYEAMDALI
jgi:hypothetical protein